MWNYFWIYTRTTIFDRNNGFICFLFLLYTYIDSALVCEFYRVIEQVCKYLKYFFFVSNDTDFARRSKIYSYLVGLTYFNLLTNIPNHISNLYIQIKNYLVKFHSLGFYSGDTEHVSY